MSFNEVERVTGNLNELAGSFEDIVYADAPVGMIAPFGGTTAPTGWLLCNGATVSRTTYSDLFAVIGTKYGAGDGSTTFNLPAAESGAALYPVGAADGLANSEYIIKAVKSALPTEFEEELALKQNVTDNELQTTSKTVPGAINEVNSVVNQTEYDEYTSQTTDTFGYLLCGLLHNADTSKITARSYVTINDSTIFHYQGNHAGFFCFSCNLVDKLGNTIDVMIGAHIDPTDWGVYRQFTVNSAGVVSMDDYSATAIGDAYNIKLYY